MRWAALALCASCASSHKLEVQTETARHVEAEIPVALPTHMHVRVPVEALGITPGGGVLTPRMPMSAAPIGAQNPMKPVPDVHPPALSGLFAEADIDFAPAPTPAKLKEDDTAKARRLDEGKSRPSMSCGLFGGLGMGLVALAAFAAWRFLRRNTP